MPSSKRDKDLARMRAERQSARLSAEAARRRQRKVVLSGVVAAVVVAVATTLVVVNTKSDSPATPNAARAPQASAAPTASASAAASASASPKAPGACAYTASGTASKPATLPATTGIERTAAQTAVLTTSQGVVTLTLDSAKAPCTVNSFTSLAKQKYFDGTTCHRLTTTGIYVLQCGDPSASGSGGPGYKFDDENLTGAKYPAGTLAMANAGAGTNGSQFFLVYKDTQLGPNYTPFGTITGGLDLLNKVAAAGTSSPTGDGKPNIPVTLTTVVIKPV